MTSWYQPVLTLVQGSPIISSVAAVSVVCLAGWAFFSGTSAVSLENLTASVDALDAKFGSALEFSGPNNAETNTQQFAVFEQLSSEYTYLHKQVVATFPTLFKDGEPLDNDNFREEKTKLQETTYKEKVKEFHHVISLYKRIANDVKNNLPKSADEIGTRKTDAQVQAQAFAQEQALYDTGAALDMRLKEDNALVKDTTLEQDVVNFVASVKSMYDGRMPTKLYNLYEQILTRVDALKRGGGRPVVGPTEPKKVQKYDLKKKEPIKPKQMITLEEEKKIKGHKEFRLKYEKKHGTKPTTPKKTEKGGLGWWWVVIIGGILAVLGVVAYLFLASDPSNDEEFSPEE